MCTTLRQVVFLATLASSACAHGASHPATQESAAAACTDAVKQSIAARFAEEVSINRS